MSIVSTLADADSKAVAACAGIAGNDASTERVMVDGGLLLGGIIIGAGITYYVLKH